MTDECRLCGAPATRDLGDGRVCDECYTEMTGNARKEGDSANNTPTPDTNDNPSSPSNPPEIEHGVFPEDLLDVEQWHTWKATDDGRKVPRAPYENPDWIDKFVSAQDPDIWTDFDTVKEWCDRLTGHAPAFSIRDRDDHPDEQFVLIDYDDVRDPDTGEVHPTVIEHIDRAESYADVSTSGSGVHIFARGELPDGVKAVEAELPEHEDFPGAEVEVYDSARYSAMTGDHIAGSPTTTTDCQAFIDDLADEYATFAEGTPDELTREPEKTAEEIEDVETTTDIQDVLDAIQHTGPRDIHLRSTVTHERSDGTKSMDPSWANSKSGTRLAQVGDGWVYRKGMHGLDALQIVALEERIITSESEYPQGDQFWKAVDALRARGAHIPEYVPEEGNTEPIAVLPSVRDMTTWDWRDTGQPTLTRNDAQQRTQKAIERAYEYADEVLIEALPSTGKSTGAIKAAAETGQPITYLAPRREVMEDRARQAREQGLDVLIAPSFPKHCDTANGEHGEDWQQAVMDPYRRGAKPKDIHKNGGWYFDEGIPCQQHEGGECQYTAMWRFDPDDYDIIIGHYNHGHKEKITSGRTVVFDEFPGDTYETVLNRHLGSSVSAFLGQIEEFPYDDFADLIEHRDDDDRRQDALDWFDDNELDDDSAIPFEFEHAHAAAPLAVYTILATVDGDLGNGWERTTLPDGGYGLFDREEGAVRILRPPEMQYASGVVALDGTPTKRMWELTLGKHLNHKQILTEKERVQYVRDVLNLKIVQTSDAMKPYSGNSEYVNTDRDAALLEEITDQHGEKPALITTLKAERKYVDEGVIDVDDDGDVIGGLASDVEHYGNLKSSNQFKEKRVAAVTGSRHFGDQYIKRWGAYAGEAVESNRNPETGEGYGTELQYTGIGGDIYQHMTHNETIQAVMRFGRDGNGAAVYVHTAALPDWVPVYGQGRVIGTWSDGMRQVLSALDDLDTATTAEIADHPDVEIKQRTVFKHLNTLTKRGHVDREMDGRGYVWMDDGLHRVNEHGDVEIEPTPLDELDDSEVAELARTSSYTWEFRNSAGDSSDQPPGGPESPNTTGSNTPDGAVSGAPPPD